MPPDHTADETRVEESNIRFLTRKIGITRSQARELIERLGNDPELLIPAAERLSKAG